MLKEIIYKPIKKDLEAIELIITSELKNEKHARIRKINDHILKTPGKRLRPALVMLSFYACGGDKSNATNAHKTAAAIELIHMASLIHDDIIDHAPIRHNAPSVQAKFGMEMAVVQGVYLYAISLDLLSQSGSITIIKRIAHAVKTLCQGELAQVSDRHEIKSLTEYLDVLYKKTGILFSTSAQCGAILANASIKQEEALKTLGNNLGIVFQIADDYMDFMGDAKTLGKDPGQDFELGEMTLPILLLLENTPNKEKKKELLALVNSKNPLEALPKLRNNVQESNALQKTKELALNYLNEAHSSLNSLEESSYRKSLKLILEFTEKRAFKHK